MRFLLVLTALFISAFKSSAQQSFSELLILNDLEFSMPEGYIEVPVLDNPDLYYNYAIRHRKIDFEIRYSIFPLQEMLQEYEASLSDSTRVMINPNNLYKSLLMVNILNVSQANIMQMPQYSEFPPKAVQEEFGCEYGATAFFEAHSTFSGPYKYCSLVYLHKKDVADVCITFLVKKPKVFEKYFRQVFYALRFAQD